MVKSQFIEKIEQFQLRNDGNNQIINMNTNTEKFDDFMVFIILSYKSQHIFESN